jgi:pyruvate-formate lyase-activating enzyme
MKKILLILASLMVSLPTIAETPMKNEITDSFTDIVKNIKENDQEILVQFTRHAVMYKMKKNNPRYEELKTKLEKLKKEEKKVKVVAVVPMMEIKDIAE